MKNQEFDLPNAIRGIAALQQMIELIGEEGVTDHDIAKILTDHESPLRALVMLGLEASLDNAQP